MTLPEKIRERRYYPMVVSEDGTDSKMTPQENERVWSMFESLPEKSRAILLSAEMPARIKELQQTFRLSDLAIGIIAVSIRSLFFGELNLSQMETKVGLLLTQAGGDPGKAREITQFIDREILHLVPAPEIEEKEEESLGESVQPTSVHLPLLKALSDYPNLGQQAVTTERIKVKGQSEPQRPTLSNWIHYYRDELGIGFHDQVQRGRFLFQSENGKRLTSEERERLNLILKSIEEELPLDIDTGRQVILFPNPASAKAGPNPTLTPRTPAVPAPAHVPAPQAVPPLSAPAWAIPQPPHSLTSQPSLAARPKVPPVRLNHPDQVPVVQNTPRFIPAKPAANVTGETLRFSTGHVLPAEHDDTQSAATMLTPPAPTPKLVGGADGIQSQPAESQRTPFSIRPVRPRRVEYKHEE